MTRIAIVGGGPKALFALHELNNECPEGATGHLQIDVFDPYPPGAGRVWQVEQPRVLRMNVTAGILDAGLPPGTERFDEWVARVEPQFRAERYPPRAVVGRYLREQFELLGQSARFELHHIPLPVTAVARNGMCWAVSSEAGTRFYDEVVIATGHGLPGERPGTQLVSARNQEPLIGQYLGLEEATIPAGSDVLIRGAALTAYDVVLLLTEGRGGRWEKLDSASGPFLCYVPDGREPATITLASVSALPMLSKAEHVPDSIRSCIEAYRQSVRAWGKGLADQLHVDGAEYNGLWSILLSCAVECAHLMCSPVTPLALWRTAMTGRVGTVSDNQSGQQCDVGRAAERIRHGIAVNRLHAKPGTHWLWAQVWTGLYPEVVQAVSRISWRPAQSRLFQRISKQLERVAFGPPELTALKILALFDAGMLEQGHFSSPPSQNTIVLDAVTPAAGVLSAVVPEGQPVSPLFGGLLTAGEVMVRPGERGLLTDADGTCIDVHGHRNESLAALGRPTEGPTLGHDTLNRTLHTEHHSWARRIARSVALQQVPEHLGNGS